MSWPVFGWFHPSRMEDGTYNQRYLVTSIKGTSYFFAIECSQMSFLSSFSYMTIGNDLDACLPSEFGSRSDRAFGRETEGRKVRILVRVIILNFSSPQTNAASSRFGSWLVCAINRNNTPGVYHVSSRFLRVFRALVFLSVAAWCRVFVHAVQL